jgi:hypothetical protein
VEPRGCPKIPFRNCERGCVMMENKKERSADFDRCIDFLVKMIELYGAELLEEIAEIENSDGNNAA